MITMLSLKNQLQVALLLIISKPFSGKIMQTIANSSGRFHIVQ